jgi:hypothetical protein
MALAEGRAGGGVSRAAMETPSFRGRPQRTEWNVRDNDGTVVFTLAPEATGGSLKTIQFARKHGKPVLHLSKFGIGYSDPAHVLQKFVDEHRIETLNVAGNPRSRAFTGG